MRERDDDRMNEMEIIDARRLEELESELRGPLSGYLVSAPKLEDTRKLILALQPEFDALIREGAGFSLSVNASLKRPTLFRQCVLQLKTYGKSFWLASLLLFTMLTLMSQTTLAIVPLIGLTDLYSLIVPLSLLMGIVYSFKSSNREMKMIESITPFPPALLFLSRMMIVLVINLLLGSVSSLYLYVTMDSFLLLPFLLHWVGPLLLLVGVLSYVMFWKGGRAGLIAGAAAWAVWISMQEMTTYARLVKTSELFYTVQIGMSAVGIALLLLAYKRCLRLPLLRV